MLGDGFCFAYRPKVKRAAVDNGQRAGAPTEMADKLKSLERKNLELRHTCQRFTMGLPETRLRVQICGIHFALKTNGTNRLVLLIGSLSLRLAEKDKCC